MLGDGGWMSLHNHTRKTSKNWDLLESERGSLVPVSGHLVQLRADLLTEVDEEWFPVPLPSGTRLFEFHLGDTRYLVDSMTLIQRLVALDPGVFAVLMSPFRGLAARVRQVGPTVFMIVDAPVMREVEDRHRGLQKPDITSLAYWMTCDDRMHQLDRCSLSILHQGELYVPKVSCSLLCEVQGLTDGHTTYVQSLIPHSDFAVSYDLTWRSTFSSIHMRTYRGAVGKAFNLTSRVEAICAARVPDMAKAAVQQMKLDTAETSRIPEVVGWGW